MVRSRCSFWSSRFRFRLHALNNHPKNLGPGNEGIRNELEVSQDVIAFCERSKNRAINILRRNSSNRFFLRSAALGKSCILHIECFIESAQLWYFIRPSCLIEVWKISLPVCSRYIQYSFHGYLSLNSNLKVVKVCNSTKLLRYEKAHSLRLLVSAARVQYSFHGY